ncbi:hypothetical protein [Microbacterium resistens]|uniref:Siderophore-interacting protein C-terminal domain-containing protein n=1 Tax=Microbacterium resistens TaxID=156977 RepID=A0ABY3RSC9_9MICO|nr:hypothetical protein [Microbacterium resistens]UGS25816.1 hypothetical protein K8F61_14315 [Microbacterium resistens]
MSPTDHDREHYVLAGVGTDVPFLNRLLGALPLDGYGQVFIESAGPMTLRGWPGPPGLMPIQVRQDLAPARDGRLPRPGEVLADALGSWAEEWLPEPGTRRPLPFTLWIGAAGHPAVDRLCARLTREHPWLHLHHPTGATASGR